MGETDPEYSAYIAPSWNYLGDVKPDNVLIDSKDNTWLIDFGGGFNSGYVDENVIETVEGDLQGVSRIMEDFH